MHNSLKKQEARWGLLFAFPAICGILCFFVLPFMVSLYYSFTDGILSKKLIGFRNYKELLSNEAFILASINTVKFIAVAVPLIMSLSLIISIMLHRKFKGYEIYRTIFVLPLVLPTASVILYFQILFNKSGALNSILSALGFSLVDWLNSSASFYVLIALYIWKNAGYNIILFMAALNAVPNELYEAASIDGAQKRHKLFKITLPLISRYSFFIFIISVINSFKVFREAYMLCGKHPNQSIYMLQHFLNNNFSNMNFQNLSSAATLIFLFVIILIGIALWRLNRNEV